MVAQTGWRRKCGSKQGLRFLCVLLFKALLASGYFLNTKVAKAAKKRGRSQGKQHGSDAVIARVYRR
jgi:hypothetical protein